jgi:hypothetical protein
MSASTALAASLTGALLVYVDYDVYHGPGRVPLAGTEFPRLLANPLEVFGDLEIDQILSAFDRSDFHEARLLAERLAQKLYEPREAECLELLAQGYGAWDRFDFSQAREVLQRAAETLDRFGERGRWRWRAAARERIGANLGALERLSALAERPDAFDQGAPLLYWYLAAAQRLLKADKPSPALMFTYASLERFVDLCLWVDYKLDDEHPDYSLIAEALDRRRYDKLGRAFFGKQYRQRDLDGSLMFANGVVLLGALRPDRIEEGELSRLKGLSAARNKCEFEHGFLPRSPNRDSVESFWNVAKGIIARAAGGPEKLEEILKNYEFPRLLADQ